MRYQQIHVSALHPQQWGAHSKVVDEQGFLLPVFRGIHGDEEHYAATLLGSFSFGSAQAASVYALEPNDCRVKPKAPKVFPVFLDIQQPFLNSPDDPFMDLSRYIEVFGAEEAKRVALKFKDHLYNTNMWEEHSADYASLEDLLQKAPEKLEQLYFELYPLLDDPFEVALLRSKGFDGAIYGGSGITAMETEYRIFSASQARSIWDEYPASL